MSRAEHSFGKYYLVHKIADGGMGEIHLAADMALSRAVAIKRVLEPLTARPDVSRMFEAEATVMSILNHDNIVRIFESGSIDGRFYIAMEYIHGKTLRQLIDRARALGEPPPHDLVISIFSQLARALHYAHEKVRKNGMPMGLVHRDVNPQNLLFGYDGSVKLIDFGIVQTDDDLAPDDLEPKGKVAYMSPEQTFGGRIDRQSDLFSLAVCLYEALTLYNPFIRGSDNAATTEAVRAAKAPPPSSTNQRLRPFDAILEAALAQDPNARLENCEQLADALTDLLATQQVSTTIPLHSYMQDTFEAQKAEEDRILEGVQLSSSSTMIVQDSASIQDIRDEAEMQPSGLFEMGEISTEYAPPEVRKPRSALPFAAVFVAIVLLTVFSSVTVYSRVVDSRRSEAIAARARFIAAQQGNPRNDKTRTHRAAEPNTKAEAQTDNVPQEEKNPAHNENSDDEPANEASEGGPEPIRSGGLKPETPSPKIRGAPADPENQRQEQVRSAVPNAAQNNAPSPAKRQVPAATEGLAGLEITTTPRVRVRSQGRFSQHVLLSSSGTISVGKGDDPLRDPFALTLRYSADETRVKVALESEPWAIVYRSSGMSLGKTPLSFEIDAEQTLEFKHPKRESLTLTFKLKPEG